MSGGSMDYLCFKVQEVAADMAESKCPSRRAFAAHLEKIAHALHEIEWVDSLDKSHPDDVTAIKAVFDDYEQRVMAVLVEDAKALIAQMQELAQTAIPAPVEVVDVGGSSMY